MAGMSVDGLVSGLDTTSLITQLLKAEAAPQTALKKRLSASEIAASAYRTVNSTFAGVVSAAETAMKAASWTATKASSSAASVSVTAGAGALQGSLTFTVDQLATAHGVVNRDAAWTSATAAYGGPSIEVFDRAGVSKGTIAIGGTGTLADAAAAINASSHGLSAAVVEISPTEYALQVSAKVTGDASTFSLTGSGTFGVTTAGQDAVLTMGTGPGAYQVRSATNAFGSVLPGATLTVSKPEATPVTVSVTADPQGVAKQVQALVDGVNNALSTIKTYSSNAPGSTAALKGDYALSSLSGRLLDAVAHAVGSDGSPATVGFQLTRDGKVTFDKDKFLAALADDPALAQRLVAGSAANDGVDGVAGTADDVSAVTGLAGRVLAVAKAASDTTTGTLTGLAKGQDSLAADLKDRIEAWDVRLAARKTALSRQFAAMETALSSLKNQSTWLAGQLNSLPSGG